jgi:thiaminase
VRAEDLVSQTREDLKAVEERVLDHPYLGALENGRIKRDDLRLFAGEQYHIITSDLRSIALVLHRHAHLPSRDYFLGLLSGEAAALQNLAPLASGLGTTVDELRDHEPMPGCQAYPSYVGWLAAYGSDADFAAAFLVNLPAWGAACGRAAAALRSQYGLQPSETAFLDAFASPPETFEDDSLRVIQDGLDRGLDARAMARAARFIQAYEVLFWDTLDEASR